MILEENVPESVRLMRIETNRRRLWVIIEAVVGICLTVALIATAHHIADLVGQPPVYVTADYQTIYPEDR